MRPILMPERARALSADWAPGPGVLVLLPPVARNLMCTALMPSSCRVGATSQAGWVDTRGMVRVYKDELSITKGSRWL